MAERPPPPVTPRARIGSDIDVDPEDVRRRGGRPSLTGEAAASPRIVFRVPPAVRARAAEIAAREGKTVSQLAREALEARITGGNRGA